MERTIDKKQELRGKAEVLKQYEVYGYRAAYFLLENEAMAEQAAMNALAELLQHEPFFQQAPHERLQTAKQAVMKQSLLVKGAALTNEMKCNTV